MKNASLGHVKDCISTIVPSTSMRVESAKASWVIVSRAATCERTHEESVTSFIMDHAAIHKRDTLHR